MKNTAEHTGAFSLSPHAQVGMVSLIVSNLDRSVRFYEEIIGFRLLYRDNSTAVLGVHTPLLLLLAKPGATPKPPEMTGLSHFALLLPGRADLARFLRHVQAASYPVQNTADHLVSEALYLADPDGNGIELYRDRPRSAWPWQNGQLSITNTSEPLDLANLLLELEGDHHEWQGLPPQTRIGHIHLQVADLEHAAGFYRDVLGFNEVITGVSGARFLAAGAYHHHLALNTWNSLGASHPPADAVGLHFFTLCLPDAPDLARMIAHLEAVGVPFVRRTGALMLRDFERNGIIIQAGMPQSSKEVMSITEAFT